MSINTATSPNSSALYYLGRILWKLFRTILMISLTFVVLYPMLYMISMSFRPAADICNPQIVWVPNSLTLKNIFMTIQAMDYWSLLMRTVFLSLTGSVAQVFMCSLIGYGFGRFHFRGQNLLLAILLLTIIVPAQIVSVPTYFNLQNLDFFGIIRVINGAPSGISLLDNPWLFSIMAFFGQGIRSGLIILMFRQFYSAMPDELESAAMVDGAGFIKTYFRIMFPNAANVTLVTFLFSFVWYWSDYFLTNIYIGNFPTLAVKLSAIRPAFQVTFGSSAFDSYFMVVIEQSACFLMVLPVLILYIFTQRYFTESIERTGIVG